MEANGLGQIRTGVAGGYATDLLANPEAETLGVIGTGFQARTQVEAIRAVRPIKTVRVWSRSEEKRRKFADDCSAQAMDSATDAVRGAQIVITATNSAEPVLEDGWIAPGTMINAMGSNVACRRELPSELVRRATLVAVDSLEQAKNRSWRPSLSEQLGQRGGALKIGDASLPGEPNHNIQVAWNWCGGCGGGKSRIPASAGYS